MNETNTEPTLQLETPLAQSQEPTGVPCPKCDKVFSNPQGLRMHILRVHSKPKGMRTGYRWKQQQSQATLDRKREYQRKLRERYKLEGKTSRGYPRKPHRWTPEQTAKFRRTMRKKKALQKAGAFEAGGKRPERIQIVYPDPREKIDLQKVAQQVTRAVIRFCPYCGESIEKHIR